MSNAFKDAVEAARRAADSGFEFDGSVEACEKLKEEVGELLEIFDIFSAKPDDVNRAEQAEELGDCLFVLANLARLEGHDPEACLRSATVKFNLRIGYFFEIAKRLRVQPETLTRQQRDTLWQLGKDLCEREQEGEG